MDLQPFREVAVLRWRAFTEFEPGGGVDGQLTADDTKAMPLDIYTPAELPPGAPVPPTIVDGVGISVAMPHTMDDVREAVRAWCREVLGRDDVEFEVHERGIA